MRRTTLITGLISSFVAVILAATSNYPYVYIPVIASLVLGLISFYLSRKHQYPTKPVQFIFIVAVIAISMAIYKSLYSNPESGMSETEILSD